MDDDVIICYDLSLHEDEILAPPPDDEKRERADSEEMPTDIPEHKITSKYSIVISCIN